MVPLTMPITRRMRSPASDSRSGRMSGMPPPTDASNRMSTPAPSAVSNSSRPWVAMSSLLAVTTGLPPISASTISVRAGSMPPMTSTTMSTSGSPTTAAASSVKQRAGSGRSRSLARFGHRDPGHLERHAGPGLDHVGVVVDEAHQRAPHVTTAEDADPHPLVHQSVDPSPGQSAASSVSLPHAGQVARDEVVERLAADHDPGVAVVDEHHRRARHQVVVGRHRVAVGAGRRGHEHVADRDVGRQVRVADEQIALLAVLARHGGDERAGASATRAGMHASYAAP